MLDATSPSTTLPARALLGRLLALRVAVLGGWIAGLAWLHAGLGIALPLVPMAAVLLLMGVFSATTAWRLRLDVPASQPEFFAHLLADLTAFAVLVFFSGGVTNPFVSLMLVPVVIAAISLRPLGVWLVAAVAGGYYLVLLVYFQPLAVTDPVAAYGMHLGGMGFNFLVSAGLVAFFVARMHASLRQRDGELAALREKQLRDERILALGTQAALAAHELATPLATIQTTAHELAREFADDPDIGADCRLLEKQAQACKRILSGLAARASDTTAAPQTLDVWLQTLIERWQIVRPDASLSVAIETGARAFAPPDGLESALINVLNNAANASPDAVRVSAAIDGDQIRIEVADRGPGLSAADRARAGRAVFERGASAASDRPGWGMGLALTAATLERLGGRLTLSERDGGGTCARVSVPLTRRAAA